MTTTPPEAPSGPSADQPYDGGPRATRDEIRDLGRLRRSAGDRKVAGVAGGLARHLDIDPVILRVAFVVLTFFGGAGLIIYGACWLLVPEQDTDRAAVTLDERSRTVALLIVGALAVFALLGDSWGVFWFPWPVAVIAVIALILLTRKDRPAPPPGAGGAPYAGAAQPGDAPIPYPAEPYAAAPYTAGPYAAAPYAGPADTAASQPVQPQAGYTQPAYPSPVEPQGGYQQQPPAPRPSRRTSPRDPRRRGPLLFWFTLALIATAVGSLGIVDLAGADVAAAAYPALAVGITGLMLVVGAFYGRAGGLILLGLVSTLGLVAATAVDHVEGESINVAPTRAAQVEDSYDIGAGELEVDLTGVVDPEELDGRTLRLEGGAGEIRVIVPDHVDVSATGHVGGPGAVDLFGRESGGIDTRLVRTLDVGNEVASIEIDAQLGVGQIQIDTK